MISSIVALYFSSLLSARILCARRQVVTASARLHLAHLSDLWDHLKKYCNLCPGVCFWRCLAHSCRHRLQFQGGLGARERKHFVERGWPGEAGPSKAVREWWVSQQRLETSHFLILQACFRILSNLPSYVPICSMCS